MKIKNLIKWYYYYQRLFFYIGVGNGEFDKPFTPLGKIALISIWIKLFFQQFTWVMTIELYFIILLFLFLLGWVSVKSGGYEFVQSMNNANNAELKEILKNVKIMKTEHDP